MKIVNSLSDDEGMYSCTFIDIADIEDDDV